VNKLIAALFVAVAVTFSAVAAEPPTTITLQAKPGNVTFPHKAHIDRVKGDCKTCHDSATGGKIADFGKDKAHKMCWDCHKAQGKGPTKCNECHKKA
jgi:predicted CXXCH cytochrome family protein